MKTAVLIFGFIRPDTTAEVFSRVRAARPEKLFLCLDAPREQRADDLPKNEAVKRIFASVDWPCEVFRNYPAKNLGCDACVAQGISWAFQQVEELIIFEDDCVPDPTFFPFCEGLLERYRHDMRVGMIAGHRANFQPVDTCGASYYFNRIPITWGWATWRRAWSSFDFAMSDWPSVVQQRLLHNVFPPKTASTIQSLYQRYYDSKITWDCAWGYSMMKEHLLCIHPACNLVSNIGFTADATHNHANPNSRWANMPTQPMIFPLSHPATMIPHGGSERARMQEVAAPNLFVRGLRYLGRKACRILHVVLAVLVGASVLEAQDLLPEVAEPAAKHKTSVETLEKQRKEAFSRAGSSYLSALNSVERSATASGKIDLVAAVVKEREALLAGTFGADLPAALPKSVQSTRKAFLASVERVEAEFARRRKQADADYLRVLGQLQIKAQENTELSKQVAQEKALLLENSAAVGDGVRAVPGKNVVANGDFSRGEDDQIECWQVGGQVKAETENRNRFVRFDEKAVNGDGTAGYVQMVQELSVSKGAKAVRISARIRVKDFGNVSKLAPKAPTANVAFMNQEGKSLLYVSAGWKGGSGAWKTFQSEDHVPENTAKARVSITSGLCPGQIDFDDVEVTFK